MKGDHMLWIQLLDEADEGPGFWLGRRPGARAQEHLPGGIKGGAMENRVGGPVLGREVPVEVHTLGVASGAPPQAVRIRGKDHCTVWGRIREEPKGTG